MLKYNHMPPLQNPNSFQAPPPSNNSQSPYDFFMGSDNTPPKNTAAGKKLLFMVAMGVGILAALAVLLAVITGGSKASPQLVSVLQSQQEIVRVAKDGTKNAQATNLKNFSLTASISLTSAQSELTTYINKLGGKVGKNELNLAKNPQTDKALAASITTSTYDTTYTSVMQGELNTYETKLQSATVAALSENERALLQRYIIGAQLLRVQLTTP
jgi:hypothetical protein